MSTGSSSHFHRPETMASSPAPSDDTLQEEFRSLVVTVDQRLRQFLLALTSNPDDAEDVLQDSYEVAWRRFADFQAGSNFYHWISRIAFNQARNFNRKRKRHRGLGLSDDVLCSLAKMNSGYSEFLEVRQQQLQQCLAKLKSLDRALILDSYRGEQPKGDLATRYGIRSDLLYKKLFRLRKKLYECINNSLGLGNRRS